MNVFGGGLALYDASGEHHRRGRRQRRHLLRRPQHRLESAHDRLVLDYVPGGVDPVEGHDNIVYDIDGNGVSASGWGHPTCPVDPAQVVAEARHCSRPTIQSAR